jgi:hypothetical protein
MPTDYLFDFADNSLTGTETVTVGGTNYTKASWAAYESFLNTASGAQDFAPTALKGTADPRLWDGDRPHQPGSVDGEDRLH